MIGLIRTPSKLIRPKPWIPSQVCVAGPYASLWYRLEHLFVCWRVVKSNGRLQDYAGDPYTGTYIKNDMGLNAGATWRQGVSNEGIGLTSSAYTASTNLSAAQPASRSIMAVFDYQVFVSGYRWVWGMSNLGGAWLCDFGVASDGSVFFYEVAGGAVNLISPTGLIALNRQHCVVCVADNTTGMRIHVDGRQVASNATTGYLTGIQMYCVSNAVAPNFSSDGAASWTLQMGGYWPRALNVHEANVLSADPFGMIRPLHRPTFDVGEAAPVSGVRSFIPAILG